MNLQARAPHGGLPRYLGKIAALGLSLGGLLLLASCGGGSPTTPTPPVGGGGNQQPPPNNLPVIDSIVAQGTRPKEPANFADAGEAVPIVAKVHDDETAAEQLTYDWSATAGTFSGQGAAVTWTAPATVSASAPITITLKVTEKYGPPGAPQAFQHDVTGTATVSLHDSIKEVGDMSRQFLLDFSDSTITNIPYVMRNFSLARCPHANEVIDETNDVTQNRENFQILNSRIGAAKVTVNFGGTCPFRARTGDACALVPAYWESIDLHTRARGAVDGNDIISAVYAPDDSRWWLCASDYDGHRAFGATLRGFIR
jgi:hypothetical protein